MISKWEVEDEPKAVGAGEAPIEVSRLLLPAGADLSGRGHITANSRVQQYIKSPRKSLQHQSN